MVRVVRSIVIAVVGMLEKGWFDLNLSGGKMYFLGLVLFFFLYVQLEFLPEC
jgi:hypothetical protein